MWTLVSRREDFNCNAVTGTISVSMVILPTRIKYLRSVSVWFHRGGLCSELQVRTMGRRDQAKHLLIFETMLLYYRRAIFYGLQIVFVRLYMRCKNREGVMIALSLFSNDRLFNASAAVLGRRSVEICNKDE